MGEALRQELNDSGVRVTLIEPGMVDTPFFDNPRDPTRSSADDIARAVMYAVVTAAARGRQRDPHPADGAVGVTAPPAVTSVLTCGSSAP